MKIVKAYKVRLYPTRTQESELILMLGVSRYVWNHFLADRKTYYVENRITLPYATMARQLTVLRNANEWMKVIPADSIQQTLRNLDKSYRRFFKKTSRLPNFKSKNDAAQWMMARERRVDGSKIVIKQGLLVRYRGRLPKGTLKSICVSHISGKWYLTTWETTEIEPKTKTGEPIGIDMGLNTLATTSAGTKYANPKQYAAFKGALASAQRSLSRKHLGSANRAKQKSVVARIHNRIKNIRMNNIHQTTHRITSKNHALIVCEDLSVAGMMKNHKLAGAIADVSWNEFIRQLEYKQLWSGGSFTKIGRFFPSSKTCSNCSYVIEELPLSKREWQCPNCGANHDRDINAAKVILQEGLRNSQYAESGKTGRHKSKRALVEA